MQYNYCNSFATIIICIYNMHPLLFHNVNK